MTLPLWKAFLQPSRLSCIRASGNRFLSSMASNPSMLRSNRLAQVFLEGKGPAMGAWQMLPGSNVSRILARTGVDWVMVDCEHGNIDDAAMHEAVPAIAALGVSPIVRIPDLQGWMIKRALDSGAHGVRSAAQLGYCHKPKMTNKSVMSQILVPLIRTVEEVESVVAAANFPPLGRRGFGSPIAAQNFQPVPSFTEYLQQANEGLLTMVQIETKEALEAVERIAPLVDVLFIGPFDLGNNIGHPIIDGKMDPELDEAIGRVLKAANTAGKKCGIFCTGGEQARSYAEQGFHMVSVATDYTALGAVIAQSLATAKGGVWKKAATY